MICKSPHVPNFPSAASHLRLAPIFSLTPAQVVRPSLIVQQFLTRHARRPSTPQCRYAGAFSSLGGFILRRQQIMYQGSTLQISDQVFQFPPPCVSVPTFAPGIVKLETTATNTNRYLNPKFQIRKINFSIMTSPEPHRYNCEPTLLFVQMFCSEVVRSLTLQPNSISTTDKAPISTNRGHVSRIRI